MWPRGFRAFKASADLARIARLARDPSRPEGDLPRFDLTSATVPDARITSDEQALAEGIGERFLSLLSALAISSNYAPAKIIVMSDRNFASEVRSGLSEYFGVTSEGASFERFASQLASEFYQWVKSHPKEVETFGLELGARGRIYLKCPELRADLEPLVE